MKKYPLIRGLGRYVPERVVTNAEMERMVETTDEWITSRTGIKERRIAAPGQATSDLSLEASRAALGAAGMSADELTHLFVCTLTPDAYCPPSACIMEEKLGVRGRIAMDLNAACSGFLFGLDMARAVVCMTPAAKVLVCACDVLSTRTNWADRRTCVLFGDGAGAAVVTSGDEEKRPGDAAIIDVRLHSDGSLGHLLTVKGGGSGSPLRLGDVVGEDFFVQMSGQEVFKHAVRNMVAVCEEVLAAHGLTGADVDYFIPHQANWRIMEAVAKKLGLPLEKVCATVALYGNTSASSVAIGLAESYQAGKIKPGDKVLLSAFGGGFTWGAVLLEF
jgi:3-oxoacyl-[acyl-carrier-protein] synthase-3